MAADGRVEIEAVIVTGRLKAELKDLQDQLDALSTHAAETEEALRKTADPKAFKALEKENEKTAAEIIRISDRIRKKQEEVERSEIREAEQAARKVAQAERAKQAEKRAGLQLDRAQNALDTQLSKNAIDVERRKGAAAADEEKRKQDAIRKTIQVERERANFEAQLEKNRINLEMLSTRQRAAEERENERARQDGITRAQNALKGLSSAAQKAAKVALSGAQKAFSIIQASVHKLGSAISAIGSRFLSAFQRSGTGAAGVLERLGTLAKQVFIFNIISKGFREITSEIGTAFSSYLSYNTAMAASVNELKMALSNVAGAIVSAFAPLANQVIPVIIQFVNWIAAAINSIGQLFGAVRGATSYKKLVANNKEAAKALKKTGDAAKQTKQNLAAFDDLDVLSKDSNSGAGSGAGAAGDVPAFSDVEVPIEVGSIDDLLESFKETLRNIPWDDIRAEARWMGETLAGILNEVFGDIELADLLGQTLAQAINTGLEFAYGFITNFDWAKFGEWWGHFVNSFLSNVDWDLLAATVVAGANGIITAFTAFFDTVTREAYTHGANIGRTIHDIFTGIDWPGAANAVLSGVRMVSQAFLGFVSEIKFTEIAAAIIEGVKRLVNGFRLDNGTLVNVWQENGRAVGALIGDFLNGVHTFVTEFPWTEAAEAFGLWFRSAVGEIDWEKVGETVNAVITGLVDMLAEFLGDPANQEAFLQSLSDFFAGLDIGAILQSLTNLAFAIGDAIFGQLERFFDEHPVLEAIAIAVTGLITVFGLVIPAASAFIGVLGLILSPAGLVVAAITAIIAIGYVLITHWDEVKEFARETWDKIKETIRETAHNIRDKIREVLDNIKEKWENAWGAIKDFAQSIWDWIDEHILQTFRNIKDRVVEAVDTVKEKWENLWEGMKNTLRSVANGIIDIINKMLSGLESGINRVVDMVNTLSFSVPDWVPAIGGSSFGLNLGHVSVPRVPYLANGAVIRGGNPFAAILGDQPAGQVNIEAPLQTIVDAMRAALAEGYTGGGGINSVTINIDGREIGEVVLDPIIGAIQRRSISVDSVFGTT